MITQQEDNSKNTSVSNLKEEGIFFEVISKVKYEDANGEEACLTDFVVTNNSKYTIKFTDEFPLLLGVNSDYPSSYLFLVNPNLEKTEVGQNDLSIKYFEPGMTANIQDFYQTIGNEYEISKIVNYEKCKRVKKYNFTFWCEGLETVLDANENEIEWESRKEEYTTIFKLHKPHPDHDKKEFGKIFFEKSAC